MTAVHYDYTPSRGVIVYGSGKTILQADTPCKAHLLIFQMLWPQLPIDGVKLTERDRYGIIRCCAEMLFASKA